MTTHATDETMLAPPGFADAVADRWADSRARVRRHRRWATTGAVVAMLLVLVVMFVSRRLDHAGAGSMIAEERSTVQVGNRAVVVAEAGTSLAWAQADGRWRVRQEIGSAFYRVETGESFVVETPEGTIDVTGTCFTVEVHSVKPTTKKLLATAGLVSTLSVATVVSLYEGRVVLASTEGSQVELEPGQTGSLVAGKPAMLVDETGDEPSVVAAATSGDRETALRHQLKMRREEVQDLEAEIEDLEYELEDRLGPEVGSDAWVTKCAASTIEAVEGCSYFDPSQDVLDEMARCGTVKVDAPPLLYGGEHAIDMMSEDLGLEGEDAEAFDRAAHAYFESHQERLANLALDAGVEPELVDRLPWHSLQQLLQSEVDKESWQSIQQRIAAERAGHVPVRDVADQSLLDRYVRLLTDVGEDLERHLADELGPERARELRAARDGWGLPGWNNTRFKFAGKCDDNGE
jgi:hypothetical protein